MNALAVDTSGGVLSLCLRTAGEAYYSEMDAGLRHSERLMEMIDALSKAAGIEPTDLNFIACMGGPGSFTGLRIGMATAKGMSVSLGIPFYSVPTFDCIARSRGFWPGTVFPVIDAKRGQWFIGKFQNGNRDGADEDISTEAWAARILDDRDPILLTGPDAEAAAVALRAAGADSVIVDSEIRRGYARELMKIAEERFTRGDQGENDEAGLHYLRKSEAEITKEAASRLKNGG